MLISYLNLVYRFLRCTPTLKPTPTSATELLTDEIAEETRSPGPPESTVFSHFSTAWRVGFLVSCLPVTRVSCAVFLHNAFIYLLGFGREFSGLSLEPASLIHIFLDLQKEL